MQSGSELQDLSGADKAAMLMMAVSDDTAAQIFSLMTPSEVRAVSQQMAKLGSAPSETVEALLAGFSDEFAASSGVIGNCEKTASLALPKSAMAWRWAGFLFAQVWTCGTHPHSRPPSGESDPHRQLSPIVW